MTYKAFRELSHTLQKPAVLMTLMIGYQSLSLFSAFNKIIRIPVYM